jgi:hypothetical protein
MDRADLEALNREQLIGLRSQTVGRQEDEVCPGGGSQGTTPGHAKPLGCRHPVEIDHQLAVIKPCKQHRFQRCTPSASGPLLLTGSSLCHGSILP